VRQATRALAFAFFVMFFSVITYRRRLLIAPLQGGTPAVCSFGPCRSPMLIAVRASAQSGKGLGSGPIKFVHLVDSCQTNWEAFAGRRRCVPSFRPTLSCIIRKLTQPGVCNRKIFATPGKPPAIR
jgi:hypothetical protein